MAKIDKSPTKKKRKSVTENRITVGLGVPLKKALIRLAELQGVRTHGLALRYLTEGIERDLATLNAGTLPTVAPKPKPTPRPRPKVGPLDAWKNS